MPLGLSGVAFGTTVFFSKYQLWFLALGIVALAVAHYTARKGRSLVRPLQARVLWASTLLFVASAGYYLYSNYFFLIR
ncbi:MAG: hypothetical protein HY675_16995 [Chloroflexi bacterium]|nr:hypothetical protein [Chloroflexota bacterium]